METTVVACIQQRMSILANRDEFEADARRFLHQAQAKMAGLVVFPELAGLMLAPPLLSGYKLGFIKRADQGKRPSAGLFSRSLGRVSEAAANMVGGGFRGSLQRLLEKNSAALQELYLMTYAGLAREFKTLLVGGSLYLYDDDTKSVRNRAYLFDLSGEVLGYQDKLNLSTDEQGLAAPGEELRVFDTRVGRFGLLLGQDVLYPELGRLLAVQGAELMIGLAACPGQVHSNLLRQALAMRAEENQVFAAAAFLVGPDYLSQGEREDYQGQSALMAPMQLTERQDGILIQTGTNRTEGIVSAKLDADRLHDFWDTSRFRTRKEMNLGGLGPVLAEMYERGLPVEQALEQKIAGPVEQPFPEPGILAAEPPAQERAFEPVQLPEPAEQEREFEPVQVPEAAEQERAFGPVQVPEPAEQERAFVPVQVPELPEQEPDSLSVDAAAPGPQPDASTEEQAQG